MKRRSILLSTIIITLSISIIAQSINYGNTIPQYNTIIFYLTANKDKPNVGETINITVIFKNYLDNSNPLYNVTAELDTIEGLNVTNVNNVLFEDPVYNKTDLFIYGTNSTPIFYWNHSYIEIAWHEFVNNETQIFWFTVELIETTARIENPILTYTLEGEEETFRGAGLGFNLGDVTNVSSIPIPDRYNWVWYWWFIGSLLVAAPLIVIVITRLTLWKR